jgi:hypothetical protein
VLRTQHIVQFPEGLLEGLPVVALLEIIIPLQHFWQFLSAKLRDLYATVPVEDCKQEDIFTDPVK